MRRGIGRGLVEFALARFPGIRTVEVLVGNTPARALYEKEGFCLTGLEKGRMPGNEAFAVEVWVLSRP